MAETNECFDIADEHNDYPAKFKNLNQKNSNWCVFVIILTQLTGFIPFGMNLTLLNPSSPAIENFVNRTYEERFNTSASLEYSQAIIVMSQSFLIVGTGIGAFAVRLVITTLSRRNSLIIANVTAISSAVLMSLIAYLSKSYEVLILGRLLNGVSRGFLFTMIPLYITEIVSRRTLAVFQAFAMSLLQFGSSLGNVLGHPDVLGGYDTWPFLMAAPAVFPAIYLISLPFLPETPTYLQLRSSSPEAAVGSENIEKNEAYVLLTKLRSNSKSETSIEFWQLCKEIDDDSKIKKATLFEIFSTPKYKKQIVGSTLLQLSAQFAGMQIVLQYTNTILNVAGIQEDHATFYSIGMFLFLSIMVVAFIPVLRRYGSKKLIIGGLLLIAFSLALLTISTFLSSSTMVYVSVTALVLYFIGIASGPLVALLSLPSEITTSRSRPMVLWFSSLVFWLVATIIVFVAPYVLSAIGGYTYIIFIVLVLLDVVYIWKFIPNTFKKSASEIQEKMRVLM